MNGLRAARVVTFDPRGAYPDNPLGAIEDGCVAFEGGRITFVGKSVDYQDSRHFPVVPLVTPGLIDAHTHACWVGSRHDEYAIRMAGGDYRAIAARGGGIVASSRSLAAADEHAIASTLRERLLRMAALGVTTCEVKSGYGLVPAIELKQLRAIAAAAADRSLPSVVSTFLALHSIPRDQAAHRERYISTVLAETLPDAALLAQFVDAYVDEGAFTVDEARLVASAARARGLGVRLHVGQFNDVGGAELAAELGALSADHLEHVSPVGIAALAAAGTAACLLPVASFTLGQRPPPVAALRAAGIPIVVASDANPGTAPTESLPLALALAVRLYGLSPEEALIGATRNASVSLGLGDRGILRVGMRADMAAWDLPHEHALIQPWGTPRTRAVVVAGNPIVNHLSQS
jgi:imidazolonepropionase